MRSLNFCPAVALGLPILLFSSHGLAAAAPPAPVSAAGKMPAASAFDAGIAAYRKGDLAAARVLLGQAVAADAENADAQAVYGFLLAQKGLYDEALPHLEKATTLKTNLISPTNSLMNFGKTLLLKPNRTPADTERAIASFEKAAALSPRSLDAQMTLGFGYSRTVRYDKAAAAYREAVRISPKNALAWKDLGLTLRSLGRNDEAYDALQKSVALNSQDADTWANVGELALLRSDLPAAQNDLETARKMDPKNARVLTELGSLYARQNAYAAAAEAYGAAADLREASPTSTGGTGDLALLRYDQGVALGQAGQNDEALAAYDKAIAANARYPEALLNSGFILYKQNKLDDAIGRFREATALKPASPLGWKNLAAAETDQKDWDGAAVAWRQVAALDPSDYDSRARLVDAILRAHPVSDEAVPYYRQMAALQPRSAEPLIGLGLLYQRQAEAAPLSVTKQEKLLLALQALQQAVRHDPRSAIAYNNLGVTHERRGEMADAITAYKKAALLDPGLTDARQNLDRFRSTGTHAPTPKPRPAKQ